MPQQPKKPDLSGLGPKPSGSKYDLTALGPGGAQDQTSPFDLNLMDQPQEEERPWWQTYITEPAKGALKQLNKIITSPAMISAPIVPKSWSQSYEPSNTPQRVGGNLLEAASYLLPTGIENKAALEGENLVRGALTKGADYLPSWIKGPATQAAETGARVISRAGTGAASNAAIAYANQENPIPAAEMGAAIPGALAMWEPALEPVAGRIFSSAQKNYERGIKPSTEAQKATVQKSTQMLAEQKRIFWSRKGLAKLAEDQLNASKARQAPLRPEPGSLMSWDNGFGDGSDVKPAIDKMRDDMFLTGRDSAGNPMTDYKAEDRALSEYNDWVSRLQQKVITDPATGKTYIPFDELDLYKRKGQNLVAPKRGFAGLPQDPTLGPEIEAIRAGTNAVRPTMEEYAGPEWADENRLQHLWLNVLDATKKKVVGEVGSTPPLSEQIPMGFGTYGGPMGMGHIPGMVTRGARRLMHSPFWSSHMGALKATIADPGIMGAGFKRAGLAADWASKGYPTPWDEDVTGQGNVTINPPAQTTAPAQQADTISDYIWDQKTQSLIPNPNKGKTSK